MKKLLLFLGWLLGRGVLQLRRAVTPSGFYNPSRSQINKNRRLKALHT